MKKENVKIILRDVELTSVSVSLSNTQAKSARMAINKEILGDPHCNYLDKEKNEYVSKYPEKNVC